MKPYDAYRDYIRQYFGPKYPHVIVLRGRIPTEWMEANLEKTYTYTVDDNMGRDYQQTIIGYGSYRVYDRDGENLYLFHDRKHVDQVIEAFPQLIVTTDPFGPDICPKCSGLSSPFPPPAVLAIPRVVGWRRGVARLLGIPA